MLKVFSSAKVSPRRWKCNRRTKGTTVGKSHLGNHDKHLDDGARFLNVPEKPLERLYMCVFWYFVFCVYSIKDREIRPPVPVTGGIRCRIRRRLCKNNSQRTVNTIHTFHVINYRYLQSGNGKLKTLCTCACWITRHAPLQESAGVLAQRETR